jgi:hypothetical protein
MSKHIPKQTSLSKNVQFFHTFPPPLHRLQSACDRLTLQVNRYRNNDNIAEPVNFNRPPEPPAAKQKTGTST